MYCSNCGKEIDDKAVICVGCGCSTKNNSGYNLGNKSWLATLLLCIFLGGFGAHRFYTNKIGSGLCQLIMSFTVVLVPITALWVLIDLIGICTGSFKAADGSDLVK